METLQEKINEANKNDRDFFNEAFRGKTVPQNLRKASERICRSYGINGICDPMYIVNLIAKELGLGNGQSHFNNE